LGKLAKRIILLMLSDLVRRLKSRIHPVHWKVFKIAVIMNVRAKAIISSSDDIITITQNGTAKYKSSATTDVTSKTVIILVNTAAKI